MRRDFQSFTHMWKRVKSSFLDYSIPKNSIFLESLNFVWNQKHFSLDSVTCPYKINTNEFGGSLSLPTLPTRWRSKAHRMRITALDNIINVIIISHFCCCYLYFKIRYWSILTDSSDGLPRSACKRPKLDFTLEEWDLSGLPWWFLGNLRSNYTCRSNGSTDIHTNQVRGHKTQNIIYMVIFMKKKKTK